MDTALETAVIAPALQRRLLQYSRAVLAARLCGGDAMATESQLGAELHADGAEVLRRPYGLFVTLRGPGNALRGCIGRITFAGPWIDLVAPVTREAAFDDHRFPALTTAELDGLTIEHSVLTEPQTTVVEQLRLGVDGIILTVGARRALFLPEVATEQRWNLEQTLAALARKAGLATDDWRAAQARIEAFRTLHYAEARA